jgi:hypothetical protein
MTDLETLTTRELCYVLALQGILAGEDQVKTCRMYPDSTVANAINITDRLFKAMKEHREETATDTADHKIWGAAYANEPNS